MSYIDIQITAISGPGPQFPRLHLPVSWQVYNGECSFHSVTGHSFTVLRSLPFLILIQPRAASY